ncbi:MAG: hypothetical protein LBB48_02480 [Treponema sp.]|nr:hypothetical protein [Treponema sp.]
MKNRLKIAFEQLRNETKQVISFVQKQIYGKYYFDYNVANWVASDRSGRLTSRNGSGIQYNVKTYLLEFKGKDEPYLLYEQELRLKQSGKQMMDLR